MLFAEAFISTRNPFPKKILFYLSIVSFSFGINPVSYSQSVQLDWVVQFGGPYLSKGVGNTIHTDAAGNVYTTGFFEALVDFDPGPGTYHLNSNGMYNSAFVSKLDSNGNLVWAKSFTGNTESIGRSVTVDNSGNVYTTGHFYETVDFDPGPGVFNLTASREADVFISKLDANGNFLWVKQIGGVSNEFGHSIHVNDFGTCYISGGFAETVDFDPGPAINNLTAFGNNDTFILKIDSNGNFIWVKQIGGADGIFPFSISLDSADNIYTTGSFSGLVDFDPGPGVSNLSAPILGNVFTLKLDPNGSFIWVKQIGGTHAGATSTMCESGYLYLSGNFTETIDFGTGSGINPMTSVGDQDCFVSKMDLNGNFIWAKQFGGTNYDYTNSITVDESGNSYCAGGFLETVDFDPGPGVSNLTSGVKNDVFILKLDSNGNFIWVKQIGGPGWEFVYSITLDTADNIFTTGTFDNITDFDPGPGVSYLAPFEYPDLYGDFDFFIQKLRPCQPTYSTDTVVSCGSYQWVDGTNYTSSTNTASYILTNYVGCDSIISLHLTIKPLGTSTHFETSCDSFSWINGNGQTYTSTTIAEHIIPNGSSNGCDSVAILKLEIPLVNTAVSVNNFRLKADQDSAVYQWIDCGNFNKFIPEATEQLFFPKFNGDYAVIILVNGCSDTSNCIVVTDLTDPVNWGIYPNPADGILFVETEEDLLIRIFDVSGKLVLSEDLNPGINHLNIRNLASGVYSIVSGSGERVRFVKQQF